MSSKFRRFSFYFYNPITYLGVFIALLFFLIECFLFYIDFSAHGSNLYLGLMTYILLPPILILGLLLIPAGALWKKGRIKKGLTVLEPQAFKVDLSLASHRNALFVFTAGTVVLVIMSLVGAYKGFEYTESIEFCGTLCHKVMGPEHTTYLQSPHGRVKCVECHVGEGADHYIKSKMAGARQVYKLATGTYANPVPTPVENLRPAEETCKQCHWPGRFFNAIELGRSYYLSDEKNSRWDMRMLMKVGGGHDEHAGIHAHMNLDQEIFYAAEDKKREKISWVKSVTKDGAETIYTTENSKWKSSSPPAEAIRKMDCIDCHNRPSHQFKAPYRMVDESIRANKLDVTIPNIKSNAMDLLTAKYKTSSEAELEIPRKLKEKYEKDYPDFVKANPEKITQASEELLRLFHGNIFPDMKTRWDVHPDNIGHLVTQGCFRCHDNGHRTADNSRIISKDCKSCHLIVSQGVPGSMEQNANGLEFKHPDGGEDWKEADCSDCHSA